MPGNMGGSGPRALPVTAEREREYSPSSCIGGDYRPYLQAYASRSRRAQAEVMALGGRWVETTCGPRSSSRLSLALPPQAMRGGCGALVFFHGGYWQELSAADSLFPAAACVRRSLAYCAVEYTLAPQAGVPMIVDECRHALAWLGSEGGRWGIDPRHIVVAGSSAGAHLAAMTCLPAAPALAMDGPRHRFVPRGAVLVSGIYLLEPLVGTSINDALGLDAEQARACSPALAPLAGFPPSVVCWGENETAAFKQQSGDFAQALRDAGSVCESFEVPQRNHFDIVLDLMEEGTLLGRASSLLAAATGVDTA